jgi:hypothetical protein
MFLLFLCVTGTFLKIQSAPVTLNIADGSSYDGVFHTATPFQNKDYVIAVKATRHKVNDCVALLLRSQLAN